MNIHTAQFGISIWLVPLAVAACQASPPASERIGSITEPITLEKCPDAIACPLPPFPDDCSGTWWNTAYDPSTPNVDCPAKDPRLTCDPVILGRCNSTYSDICKYRGCPGYIVLNMSDWTIQQNDRFIACAQAGLLDNQCDTIVVGSPSNHVPDPNPGTTGSVTYRELCQLNACGCPTVFDETGGEATCGCAPTQGITVEVGVGLGIRL